MKQKPILIWSISAVLYLAIVMGAYSVYASIDPTNESDTNHHKGTANHPSEEMGNPDGNHDSDHSSHDPSNENEVNIKVENKDNVIRIELKDKENNAPELEVSHEKIMHLIIVSSDLQEYHHLHPVEKGEGVFEQKIDLKENSYKVFVDIKPKGLAYSVQPIKLHVGDGHSPHKNNDFKVDTDFEKTINNKTVELSIDSLKVNKSTTLTFDTKGHRPESYLGALGHVVILDENGERFIHVHPASEDKTVFLTEFNEPGIYKLWGEFKFGEVVNVYPFVIEVK